MTTFDAWRVGSKIPINVYEGDRPVCQCQSARDARLIVTAVNKFLDEDNDMKTKAEDAKKKYATAFQVLEDVGGKITKEKDGGERAYIMGSVPSQEAKNKVWDAVKKIDSQYNDLMLDLVIDEELESEMFAKGKPEPPTSLQGDEQLHHPALPPEHPISAEQTKYTVKPGDTLSKIARQFYHDASKYTEIFDANTDQLTDPNQIKPGQVLVIPDITV